MATRVVLTYKDYEALPADGRRYELHEQQACRARSPWGAKDVADRQDEIIGSAREGETPDAV